MKKIAALTIGLLLTASAAMAAGVNLYVGDCGGGTSTNSFTNACTKNSGSGAAAVTLVASVVLDNTDPDFIGAATIIDLQSSASSLPAWWDGSSTGCRSGSISANENSNISPDCPTLWDGRSDVLPVFAVQPLVGGPNRVRFNSGAAITSSIPILGGGTEYGVMSLVVNYAKTVGTGACAGCSTGACIVLNEINLQPASTTTPWTRFTAPATNNFVTFQAGAPVCAGSTPTANHSWGSLKALYR